MNVSLTRCWPIAAAFLLGAWLAIDALWPHWTLNPQYQYGQIVPFLCIALFLLRWRDRPPVSIPSRGGKLLSWVAIAFCVSVIAIARPVLASNAEWRLPVTAVAFSAVAILLAAIHLAGGPSWLGHFAFPALFFLVSVPWPSTPETKIMDLLMNGNAGACVEALQWAGFEADQRGNMIVLPSGMLEVEEVCSGVRSLQSEIMVSLLFGEFFRLGIGSRFLLVLLGLGAALIGNFLRTFLLAIVSNGNPAVVEKWHDPAGFGVLILTMAAVGFVGWRFSKRASKAPAKPSPDTTEPLFSRLAGLRPAAFSICAVWLAAIGGTEAWYRAHDRDSGRPETAWTFEKAAPNESVQEIPIPARTQALLLNPNVSASESWSDANGLHWHVFFFRWNSGYTAVELAMSVHDPRICLELMGLQLRQTLEPIVVEAAGFRVPFRRFFFSDGHRSFYVFHAVVKDQSNDRIPYKSDGTYRVADRLRYVLAGRRNHGLKVLEFAVWGAPDLETAEHELEALLEKRLQREGAISQIH